MKKAMAILLAAVLALACTACGGSKNGETKDRLAQIKEKGYIELCTEPNFAPFEYVDPSKSGEDQYQGMDIEVAKYIADKIGVDLKITALDFTAVLAGVADGKYDFAISAIAYAPSRAEAMRLSDVYYSSNIDYGFIVRTEDAGKYNDLDSLKDAVVITQSGSVQEALYNQYINGACKEFKLVANMTDGYLAVAEGKADVCICSTASAQLYADANGGMSIPDYRFEVDPNMNGTCVAMPMDDTESLAEVVNQCIAELKENGQTDVWYSEYEEQAAALGIEYAVKSVLGAESHGKGRQGLVEILSGVPLGLVGHPLDLGSHRVPGGPAGHGSGPHADEPPEDPPDRLQCICGDPPGHPHSSPAVLLLDRPAQASAL